MEEIENDRNMKIFVDYAHTPDAIENVILTATELK
jgi:UDP-N-acetylmuramoyl-L-alanyl-D-glutamate--2,6-diaminopimelate ligase